MNIKILLISSLRSLKHQKFRSLLTMLGVIIGIGSIITIMAIGHGAEMRVKEEILASGDNYVFIHLGNWLAEEKGHQAKRRAGPFSPQDIAALEQHVHHIKNISPTAFSKEHISTAKKAISTEVKSGNHTILSITGRKIEQGQPFNQTHVQKGSFVVVLGNKAAHELFGGGNSIGKNVQIKKISFTVIGVLRTVEKHMGFNDPNMDVFIPFSTAKKLGMAPHGNKIKNMILSIDTLSNMPKAVKQTKKLLRARRRLGIGEPDDFMIWDQDSMLKAAKTSSSILNMLLFIIATISLVVGGIGVMNIMLVSVRERTQEIGIRMALGAQRSTILKQFLIEAITLCGIGGIIGIGLGCMLPYLISIFTGWQVIITPLSIALSLFGILFVGIIFGYYPAHKASKLNPVQALSEQ